MSPTIGPIRVPLSLPQTRCLDRRSPLEVQRSQDVPQLPKVLESSCLEFQEYVGEVNPPVQHAGLGDLLPNICGLKAQRLVVSSNAHEPSPLKVGVANATSTLAASGAHNVILGLQAFLSRSEFCGSKLWVIPHLVKGNEFEITSDSAQHYLNQAGSDLLPGMPLLKVTDRMLVRTAQLCNRLDLDALVLLCGHDEAAEVSKIADNFAQDATVKTVVIAVIHSFLGLIKVPHWLSLPLGFDTACGVLSEVVGNIALSEQALDRDIYRFVCCGSPPLTLEVAMQVRPTLCFIGEDVAERELTLQNIIDEICDVIVSRHHEHGLHSGLVLVSDNFFENLVEMRRLREELQRLRKEQPAAIRSEESAQQLLPQELGAFFAMLPADVCYTLVFRNDNDGLPLMKPQEAERELGSLVSRCLADRAARGLPSVLSFVQQPHNLRHLAPSAMPTPLDSAMGYAIGHVAGALAKNRSNGFIPSITELQAPSSQWKPCALPLTALLDVKSAGGHVVARLRHLTSDDKLFRLWQQVRHSWITQPSYRQPGPVQYWGLDRLKRLGWTCYTLKADSVSAEELAREFQIAVDSKPMCPQNPQFKIVQRHASNLSPLQAWRAEYKPRLPSLLQGKFQISEVDRKGSVCADAALVHLTFPNLWRSGNSKAIQVEPMAEEVNLLQMLPNKSPLHRIESAAGGMHRIESMVGSASSPMLASDGDSDDGSEGVQGSKLRVGIVIIGRFGPGVNNVIQGIFDYVSAAGGVVLCITMGLKGLVNGQAFELTSEILEAYRNQGGCDLLGHSRPQDLRSLGSDLASCAKSVKDLDLEGLVVWGGRNVHSWTPRLAEYFLEHGVPTRVVGIPASVQSDIPMIEQTLGYDTVCKLFSSVVGNLGTQAASLGKLWCFVRIPGKSIFQIAGEVALETHPHVVVVSEVDLKEIGLPEITQMICNVIEERSRCDKNYGVVLIPDQLLASVREMRQLLDEMVQICKACPGVLESVDTRMTRDFGPVLSLLSPLPGALFQSFPERVRAQICSQSEEAARNMQNEIDLSNVETEVIFQTLVEKEINRRVVLGSYKGPFQSMTYSLADHGRAAMPTNFDCDLGYTSGFAAAMFVAIERTGILIDISKLKEDVESWQVGATPLSSFLTFTEQSKGGAPSPYVIQPKRRMLYDMGSGRTMPEPVDRTLISPGPAQLEGPCASIKTQTLCMPQLQRVRQMEMSEQLITELKTKASAGCPPEVLQAVKMLLQGGVEFLKQL